MTPQDREMIDPLGCVDPVEAVAVTDEHHDATAVYLRCRRPSGEEITVHVFCEASLRGAATEFGYGYPIPHATLERAADDSGMLVEHPSLADARAWFDHAAQVREAEFAFDPDDEQEALAAEHRAVVAHYFHQCPDGGHLPARAQLTRAEEVPALVAEFVASPFADGLDDAGAAAEVLAEFGMVASGRPLWWSPMAVEMFARYAPQVLGAGAMKALAPAAKAWASWADERLAKTSAAVSETRRAIDAHASPLPQSRPGDLLVLPGLGTGADDDDGDGDDWLIEAWDRHAVRVAEFVRDGLAGQQGAAPPELGDVAATIRRGVASDEWPYSTLRELSHVIARRLSDLSDEQVVLWAASVMIDPDPDFDDPQPAAGDSDDDLMDPLAIAGVMDPIDWADVTVGLGRSGPGTSCTPEHLVKIMAELSEQTEDDAEILEMFFEMNRSLWRAAGVTDAGDTLADDGVWALPRALCPRARRGVRLTRASSTVTNADRRCSGAENEWAATLDLNAYVRCRG